MNIFSEALVALTAFIVFIFALVFGMCLINYYGAVKPACEQYSRLTGSEISTQFFGDGCLVKYDGRWVDYSVATQKKQEVKVTR